MSAAPTLEADRGLGVDLVNAALLGTDRRPLPSTVTGDAAGWLLGEAARRRAARLVAGASTTVALGEPGPPDDRPLAPPAAGAVLDDILRSGSSGLLDLWLREALDAGVRLAPEHWVPLLDRSRRSTDLDRGRLARALGPRGLWCARHNPAWSLVVRASGAGSAGTSPPTPDDLVALTANTPATAARALGVRAGTSLPLRAYASVGTAAATTDEPVPLAALAAAEEILWARWGLALVFDPARIAPDRRPVRTVAEERP